MCVKKNEIMDFVAKWIELGKILLSKITWTQKDMESDREGTSYVKREVGKGVLVGKGRKIKQQ